MAGFLLPLAQRFWLFSLCPIQPALIDPQLTCKLSWWERLLMDGTAGGSQGTLSVFPLTSSVPSAWRRSLEGLRNTSSTHQRVCTVLSVHSLNFHFCRDFSESQVQLTSQDQNGCTRSAIQGYVPGLSSSSPLSGPLVSCKSNQVGSSLFQLIRTFPKIQGKAFAWVSEHWSLQPGDRIHAGS